MPSTFFSKLLVIIENQFEINLSPLCNKAKEKLPLLLQYKQNATMGIFSHFLLYGSERSQLIDAIPARDAHCPRIHIEN